MALRVLGPRSRGGPGRARALGHSVSGRPRLIRYRWHTLSAAPGVIRRVGSMPGYFRELHRWLSAGGADVVHVNTLPAIPEALVARAARKPVVLHVHEMLGRGAVRPGRRSSCARGLGSRRHRVGGEREVLA